MLVNYNFRVHVKSLIFETEIGNCKVMTHLSINKTHYGTKYPR